MAIDFDRLVLGPCMDTFGIDVSYQPVGASAPVHIKACFDATAHQISFDHDDAPVSTNKPVLGVRLSDFAQLSTLAPCPGQGDLVEIDGVFYQVKDINPDGVGHARLGLIKQV